MVRDKKDIEINDALIRSFLLGRQRRCLESGEKKLLDEVNFQLDLLNKNYDSILTSFRQDIFYLKNLFLLYFAITTLIFLFFIIFIIKGVI